MEGIDQDLLPTPTPSLCQEQTAGYKKDLSDCQGIEQRSDSLTWLSKLSTTGFQATIPNPPSLPPVQVPCSRSTPAFPDAWIIGLAKYPWFAQVKMAVSGASLVAQWLRVCLPMQGTWVRALVWEDPTCRGATGSVSHNY